MSAPGSGPAAPERSDRGPRPGGGGGGGGRGGRFERRGEQSVKARLRAKARKKARKKSKKMFTRRKVCRFCADPNARIEYKDPKTLRFFVSETGKLIPRRISGNCARHQRRLSLAVKRARILALLPSSSQHI